MPGTRWLLVLATTAGVVAAGVVTLLQDSTYRADAAIVLVRQGQPPGGDPELAAAADAASALFESRAVTESAARNLGTGESPQSLLDRLDVEAEEGSSLVRIGVEAPTREEARRTAQEVSEVATVLFNDRFAPGTVASVWERASADDDRVSPSLSRNLALGGLLGALAGLFATAARRRALRISPRPAPASEAPAAAEPAPTTPAPVPAAPVAGPPAPGPTGRFTQPRLGEWTVDDVERLLAEQGSAFPDRAEELRGCLESVRAVAEPDGSMAGGVEAVVEDVFHDLIERSAQTQR